MERISSSPEIRDSWILIPNGLLRASRRISGALRGSTVPGTTTREAADLSRTKRTPFLQRKYSYRQLPLGQIFSHLLVIYA